MTRTVEMTQSEHSWSTLKALLPYLWSKGELRLCAQLVLADKVATVMIVPIYCLRARGRHAVRQAPVTSAMGYGIQGQGYLVSLSAFKSPAG